MFIDRLIEKIKLTDNPSVIGLDPRIEFIPEQIMQQANAHSTSVTGAIGKAFFEFNRQIIDAIADIVPCVKPQLACYEAIGLPGLQAFDQTVRYAKEQGLLVIADGKRNDIGSSAEGYAQGFFSRHAFACDALTVNPYLGYDGIEPFIKSCRDHNTGIFILAKTSNPSSGQLQDLLLQSGATVAETVAGPVRFQIRFDADSVDHVDLVPNDGTDQREGAGRVIRIVAIDQEVNIGLDVCEHSTNDVTFALQRFRPANCAGSGRDF